MMEKSLYFAYGSNINLDQMRYRCPDATVYGQAVLDNFDLRFRGSGVATVEPKEGACVYGLLWELTDKCEASLDRYEGYPRLYIKQTLEVRTFDGQRVPVMAYIMNPELHLKPSLPPRDYYLGIKTGYEQNGLPVGCLKYAFKNCLKECGIEPYPKKVQAKASQKKQQHIPLPFVSHTAKGKAPCRTSALCAHYWARSIISSRLGPLESIVSGHSISFSINSIYRRQFSGRSS